MINDIGTLSWLDDKQALFLTIGAQLPSLNEYIGKCRTNPYVGAKFKSDTEEIIINEIISCERKGTLRPVKAEEYPVTVEILWREHTAKRDVDNIKSAAKFIMDALTRADIISGDGQKQVSQIYDKVIVDKTQPPAVIVKIIPRTRSSV